MRRIKNLINSLSFKIALMVILVEVIVLFAIGFIYIGRFVADVDSRMETHIKYPSILMQKGALNYDAIADSVTMKELLRGEDLINGEVIGPNRVIFHSLDKSLIGFDAAHVLEDVPPNYFDFENPRHELIRLNGAIVSLSPIIGPDGVTAKYFVYVKLGTAHSDAE